MRSKAMARITPMKTTIITKCCTYSVSMNKASIGI
jgi:hypothetical protein